MCGHPVERCVAQCSDFGCVSSKILWIKFKFSRVKVCVVVGYGPSERDVEERDRFWNNIYLFYYVLASICDPMVNISILYRGAHV